eukprot:scaffold21242_cov37-Tisochrysis_lutea.AAC.2
MRAVARMRVIFVRVMLVPLSRRATSPLSGLAEDLQHERSAAQRIKRCRCRSRGMSLSSFGLEATTLQCGALQLIDWVANVGVYLMWPIVCRFSSAK